MLGSIKAAIASIATSIKSSLPTVVAATTATVVTGGCIYYYTIKDGMYEKKDSNARFVIEEYINQISLDSIVENGEGGYTYTKEFDKMIDKIIEELENAGSNFEEYTTSKKKREVIEKIIRAEFITQYPDLRSEAEIKRNKAIRENELQGGIKIVRRNSNEDTTDNQKENDKILEYEMEGSQILTYIPYENFKTLIDNGDKKAEKHFSLKPSSLNSNVKTDLIIKTDVENAAPVLTKKQIEEAIRKNYTMKAQTQLLKLLDTIMKVQEEDKVNAVFLIAVAEKSSLCGTLWQEYESSTNNWLGVNNGNYTSLEGATEKFGEIISGDTYFGSNKYKVSDISSLYNSSIIWQYAINENMAQIYESINIKIEEENTTKPNNAEETSITNPSVDIVVAGSTSENIQVETIDYTPKEDGSGDIRTENKEDLGTEVVLHEVDINYQIMLSKYQMPAGFLWSLLVMGENPDFITKLADLAIDDTEIIIEAQDNITVTTNQKVQKYRNKKDVTKTVITEDGTKKETTTTVTAQNESSITTTVTTTQTNTRLNLVYAKTWVAVYKEGYKNKKEEKEEEKDWQEEAEWEQLPNEIGETITVESEKADTDKEYEELKKIIKDEITIEKCKDNLSTYIIKKDKYYNMNKLFMQDRTDSNAETNSLLYEKSSEYIYNYIKGDFTEKFITKNTTLKFDINSRVSNLWNQNEEYYIQNNITEENLKKELFDFLKLIANDMITLSMAEKEVTNHKVENSTANNIETVNTNTYTSTGTEVQERTEVDKEKNFVKYFNESGRAKEYILQSPSWVYEMLESHEKTANMVDLFKYLLYKSTGTDYGVTTFDFSLLDKNSFNSIGGFFGASFEEKVWWALIDAGYSKEATAGAMGNFYGESGFRSNNLENSFESILGYTDETYTEAVDNGSYTKQQFISDHTVENCGAGYGLAQWTWYTLKEGLYDYAKYKGVSIADENMQIEYMLGELSYDGGAAGYAASRLGSGLNGFTSDDWKNATTPEAAAKAFCWFYERPVGYDSRRETWAREYYERYKDKEKPGFSGNTVKAAGYEFPHYLQADFPGAYSQWDTIPSGGCGPTSLSMILAGYLREPSINPWTVVENIYDMWPNESFYVENVGSSWCIFENAFLNKYYGVSSEPLYDNRDKGLEALEKGYALIGGETRSYISYSTCI